MIKHTHFTKGQIRKIRQNICAIQQELEMQEYCKVQHFVSDYFVVHRGDLNDLKVYHGGH